MNQLLKNDGAERGCNQTSLDKLENKMIQLKQDTVEGP